MILKLLLYNIVIVLCIIIGGRLDKSLIHLYYAIGIVSFIPLFKTISLSQMVYNSQINVPKEVTNTSIGLLECLEEHFPQETYIEDLKNCVHNVEVYSLRLSRLPYMNMEPPIAFVVPYAFTNKMFMVHENSLYLDNLQQSIVIIHECTHIALNTVDHAYRWQSKFNYLSDKEHENNADSYVDVIVNKCLNGISVFL